MIRRKITTQGLTGLKRLERIRENYLNEIAALQIVPATSLLEAELQQFPFIKTSVLYFVL